jgi:hypothetical protein
MYIVCDGSGLGGTTIFFKSCDRTALLSFDRLDMKWGEGEWEGGRNI